MMDVLKHIRLVFNKQRIILLLGAFLYAPFCALNQVNLVVNQNCDVFDTCPETTGQISRATGWWTFDSWGTPDYFNVCGVNPPVTIPSYFGYQLPLSGEGYIHSSILSCHKPVSYLFWTGPEYGFVHGGESFGGTLLQPLKPVPHIIEFYVSFSKVGFDDGFGGGDGRIATNAFDLLLRNSNEMIYNSVTPYINLEDVIKINKGNNVINDTLNWVKLSTCFIPKGGETFFAIGAFRDTTEIVVEFSGGSYANGYVASYYFENFSIYECDTCCLGQFPYEDHVSISSNPGTDNNPTTFSVLINPNTTGVFSIFDSAGRLIEKHDVSELLTMIILKKDLAVGIYHYELSTSNGVKDVGKVLVNSH